MRYIKLAFSLNRILTIVAFMSVVNFVSSQDKFHRTYPLFDNEHFVFAGDLTQLSNGLYASVDFFMHIDPNDPQNLISDTLALTAYKAKGDVEFSFLIPMDPAVYGGINTGIKPSIVEGKDGLVYVHFATNDGPNGNKHRANFVGNVFNVETYSVNDNSDYEFTSAFKGVSYSNSLIHAFTAVTDDSTGVILEKSTLPNLPVSSGFVKKYTSSISEYGVVTDMDARNNRIAAVGNIDSLNLTPYLLVTDSTGKVLFSESFFNAQNFGTIVLPQQVKILPDTGYIVAGLEVIGDPLFGIKLNGFLTRFDKKGDIIWSKTQTSGTTFFDIVKSMSVDKNNNLIVTSANADLFTSIFTPFAAKFTLSGDELEKKKYTRMLDNFDAGGTVIAAKAGGVLWTGTQINPDTQLPVLSLLRLDDELSSSCEEEFTDEVFFDVEFITDTLEWTVSNPLLRTTKTTTKPEGNQFDIPVLSLNVRPFCPNEPINWLFEVPIEGATFYEWSTGVKGDKLDSLRVFEEGKYSVTVTVDKDVCFMLCDTSELSRYELPQASLGVSLGNFCANNKLTINADYVPGHPQVKNFIWSPGGETTSSIEVANPGTYSMTLTDGCDEKANATVTLGEFPKKLTEVTVTPQIKFNCSTGRYTGRIEAKGNSTTEGPLGLGVERFKWSNGNATTNFINIDQDTPVDIVVTVTDGCGNTATGTFKSTPTGENLMKPSIVQSPETCKIRLNVVDEVAGNYKYSWASGETTSSILVDKDGTYKVTITDLCGNTRELSGQVTTLKFTSEINTNNEGCKVKLNVTTSIPSGTYTYLWSSGETTSSILADKDGTFKVTVTDNCNNPPVSSEIKVETIKPKVELEINRAAICATGAIDILAKATSSASPVTFTYLWSNGAITSTINIKDPGKYTVTVTDDCKNTAVASSTIKEDDLKPEGIEYPRVFFPDGFKDFSNDTVTSTVVKEAHLLNRTFGPILTNQNACPDQIQEYEFYVFNRWNQQVFESTNIKDEWDGKTPDGTDHHTETYMYVAKYKVIGKEKIVKGSINLLR